MSSDYTNPAWGGGGIERAGREGENGREGGVFEWSSYF